MILVSINRPNKKKMVSYQLTYFYRFGYKCLGYKLQLKCFQGTVLCFTGNNLYVSACPLIDISQYSFFFKATPRSLFWPFFLLNMAKIYQSGFGIVMFFRSPNFPALIYPNFSLKKPFTFSPTLPKKLQALVYNSASNLFQI